MTVVQANVLAGLYTHLTGDAAFNTSLGGDATTAGRLYWDLAPEGTAYPYAVMSVIASLPRDTFTDEGFDYRIQFSIFDDADAGPKSCVTIADNLHARLHRQTFTITGHDLESAFELIRIGPVYVDGAWQVTVDYRISGFDQ